METTRQSKSPRCTVMGLIAVATVAAAVGIGLVFRHVRPTHVTPGESLPPPAPSAEPQPSPEPQPPSESQPSAKAAEDLRYTEARHKMVQRQLRDRDITDPRVLEVMGRVPRQRFMPEDVQPMAYEDGPVPIGYGQTISQPYIVALMTQAVRPRPNSRALDIGTGSGYQAAVLAELCKEVYSIEILQPLADSARQCLADLGYKNITVRCGDGYRGWPERAPFDLIVVAAAPDHVPQPLVDQLAPGGRLVIPIGDFFQELLLIERQQAGTIRRTSIAPVRFVPMRGEAEKAR